MNYRFSILVSMVLGLTILAPGQIYGQYQPLGGKIEGDPSCASPNDGTGQVICAAKGTDNALYGIRFNPATNFTTGYQGLGGIIEGDPSCASSNDSAGAAICGQKGTDNALYGIAFRP